MHKAERISLHYGNDVWYARAFRGEGVLLAEGSSETTPLDAVMNLAWSMSEELDALRPHEPAPTVDHEYDPPFADAPCRLCGLPSDFASHVQFASD